MPDGCASGSVSTDCARMVILGLLYHWAELVIVYSWLHRVCEDMPSRLTLETILFLFLARLAVLDLIGSGRFLYLLSS